MRLGCILLLVGCLIAPRPGWTTAPEASATPTPIEQALELYRAGDFDAARRAFERLAALGIPTAQYNLAVMHLRGELPDASEREGRRWMTLAAERGFVTAMVGLAQLFERGDADGRRDLAAAHRWYLRAAESGSVQAQVEAATAYYLGRGTAKNLSAAAHWYREAAKRGDVGAQYLIASMYEQGLGVARDLRLARYWYEQCARNGDVAAPAKVRELDASLALQPPQ